jgi:DNA invertase Pin-like site-specific DNA recombinase
MSVTNSQTRRPVLHPAGKPKRRGREAGSKSDFVACDMPSANAFMINVYAAVAQGERRMISDHTKAGLAAAKARSNETRQAGALERARAIAPILSEFGWNIGPSRGSRAERPQDRETVIRARARVGFSAP